MNDHSSSVRSVIFNSDSKILLSGSDDRTIKRRDVQTGRCISTLTVDRLYKGMNIQGTTELATAQKATMKTLGATER